MGAGTLRTGVEKSSGVQEIRKAADIKKALTDAIGKVLDYGKGAVADVGSKGIEKLEYRLHDEYIESAGLSAKTIKYSDISRIEASKRGQFRLIGEGVNLSIKPYAWLQVSGVRVPLGWVRNGMEVPFELLIEEIVARSKAEVVSI